MNGFEVRASYFSEEGICPVTDAWLCGATGVPHSFSGVGACLHGHGRREIGWEAKTFSDAAQIMNSLRQAPVDGLIVTMREG